MPKGYPIKSTREEVNIKIGLANKGKKSVLGKHWKIKDTSNMHQWGRKITWGDKISKAVKGKKKSEIHRKHISDSHKGLLLGEKHPNWKGGISFEPYSVDWTETLKKSIRERDKYTCQICGKEPAIIVHHIDYDKKNNDPENLITVCDKCHGKTQFNRSYWQKLLTKKHKLL